MFELPTESEPVRIIQGDCLEVLRSLPHGCVDAVVTDPPFCSGAATEAGRGSATHQGLRSETMQRGRFDWFSADNMTTSGLVWLLREMAVAADRILVPGGSILVFCDWRMAFAIGPGMESAGFRLRNLVVWDKGHFGCGSGFRPQHELVLHLTRRAPEFYAADVGNVIRTSRVQSADRDHPTEKPVELISQLIRVVSPRGALLCERCGGMGKQQDGVWNGKEYAGKAGICDDCSGSGWLGSKGLVVDPFAGSGTTGVAAIAEGRRAILIEKEPAYVAIAQRRIDEAMGRGVGSLFTEVV